MPVWLKSGSNMGHCTWRPKYVLLLPATLNRHISDLLEWNGVQWFWSQFVTLCFVDITECEVEKNYFCRNALCKMCAHCSVEFWEWYISFGIVRSLDLSIILCLKLKLKQLSRQQTKEWQEAPAQVGPIGRALPQVRGRDCTRNVVLNTGPWTKSKEGITVVYCSPGLLSSAWIDVFNCSCRRIL